MLPSLGGKYGTPSSMARYSPPREALFAAAKDVGLRQVEVHHALDDVPVADVR